MRVTLVGYGSEGDVRPLAALGLGLRDSGHDVVVTGDASGEDLVTRHSLAFAALSGDVNEVLATGVSARGIASFQWRDPEWIDEIAAAAAGSDVVVGLPIVSVHAMAAADRVGALGVLAGLQPMEPTHDFVPSVLGKPSLPAWLNRPVGRAVEVVGGRSLMLRVNRVRRAAGEAPFANPYHRLSYLGAWSPTLVPTPADWDAGSVVTGQWRLAEHVGWAPPDEVAAFLDGDERPVYVGFGSVRGPRVEYAVEQVLQALAGHRVLLASPYDGEVGADVLRVGSLPHEWLFPRCGAIVHAAGAGTAHAAARSGVPSVPVPFALDQPFWADRLYRLGFASRPVDPRSGWEAYESALRETVALREPATELTAKISTEDGVAVAVATLERLAASTHL
jgi:UDP:flavonoid glycosyltransferase YjiC (YdhE family)